MFSGKSTKEERDTIKNLLVVGRANGKTDIELSRITGIDKRMVRHIAGELLSSGIPVCNLHNGKGFFLAETREDLVACKKYTHSYILSLLKKEYRIDKAIEAFGMERMA
jgi:hypothetical protein